MNPAEAVPALPDGINVAELTPNDIHRISCWLITYAAAAIAESGCASEEKVILKPNPKKKHWESPLNDYTEKNIGAPNDLGVFSIDAYVNTGDTGFNITHGVVIESECPQDFGALATDETIIVQSGKLRYWINDKQGSDIDGSSSMNVIALSQGDNLKVQAIKGPVDYSCFYGKDGSEYVKNIKNL